MQGELPIFEGPEDALRAAVQAVGGAKVVGAKLWPHLTVDAAARKLLDAINPDRHEKLDLAQVLLVLRLAHEKGAHAPMQWLATEAGYEARPVTPQEQVDRLAAVVAQASTTLADALARIERLQRVRPAA